MILLADPEALRTCTSLVVVFPTSRATPRGLRTVTPATAARGDGALIFTVLCRGDDVAACAIRGAVHGDEEHVSLDVAGDLLDLDICEHGKGRLYLVAWPCKLTNYGGLQGMESEEKAEDRIR